MLSEADLPALRRIYLQARCVAFDWMDLSGFGLDGNLPGKAALTNNAMTQRSDLDYYRTVIDSAKMTNGQFDFGKIEVVSAAVHMAPGVELPKELRDALAPFGTAFMTFVGSFETF